MKNIILILLVIVSFSQFIKAEDTTNEDFLREILFVNGKNYIKGRGAYILDAGNLDLDTRIKYSTINPNNSASMIEGMVVSNGNQRINGTPVFPLMTDVYFEIKKPDGSLKKFKIYHTDVFGQITELLLEFEKTNFTYYMIEDSKAYDNHIVNKKGDFETPRGPLMAVVHWDTNHSNGNLYQDITFYEIKNLNSEVPELIKRGYFSSL